MKELFITLLILSIALVSFAQIDTIKAMYYYKKALKYHLSKDYESAKNNYDSTLIYNPKDALAYFNRGLMKYYLKDYHGSIDDYDKSIILNPNYSTAYDNTGYSNMY